MSAQKNKTIIAITLAMIAVFLLGGVSFTFFPSQTSNSGFLSSTQDSELKAFEQYPNSAHIMWSRLINATESYILTSLKPLNSIAIQSDGSINSTTAPIVRNGDVYTQTSDIFNQTILIQKDNVVFDGANHILQGNVYSDFLSQDGVEIQNVNGVTIKNLNVNYFFQGIMVQNCTNLTLENNNFANDSNGIRNFDVNDARVIGNTFNNTPTAITFSTTGNNALCRNNVISKNSIIGAYNGIFAASVYGTIVSENMMMHVNNPIYAGKNAQITNNQLFDGATAISINSYNTISGNFISNFSEGMFLNGVQSSIIKNTVANCTWSIVLSESNDNYPLDNNTLYHNNFINYSQPLSAIGNASLSLTNWDNGAEGNFWSSYNGADSNGDGIGDIAYVLAENCTDRYPLIQPYVAQSPNLEMGQLFFVAAAVAAAVGAIAVVCLLVRFRGHH
jgi:parallel beta-helix repeat protein